MCEGYSSCQKADFLDKGFRPFKSDRQLGSDYVRMRNQLKLSSTALPFTFDGNTKSAAAWVPEGCMNDPFNVGFVAYVAVLKLPCARLEDPSTQYYGGALEPNLLDPKLDTWRALGVIADDATVGCNRFTDALFRAKALVGIK